MAAPHLQRNLSEVHSSSVWVTPSGILTLAQLRLCIDELAADHVIWTEDYPYILCDDIRAGLERADLGEEDCEKIAHSDAERVFGLK